MSDSDRTPNPIDIHVGQRVRMRRRLLGVGQEKLAEDLGLTFQQVQKYERGANRISASKLYEIARSLSTSISYFFDGLKDPSAGGVGEDIGGEEDEAINALIMTPHGFELAVLFKRAKPAQQIAIVRMLRAYHADRSEAPADVNEDLAERRVLNA